MKLKDNFILVHKIKNSCVVFPQYEFSINILTALCGCGCVHCVRYIHAYLFVVLCVLCSVLVYAVGIYAWHVCTAYMTFMHICLLCHVHYVLAYSVVGIYVWHVCTESRTAEALWASQCTCLSLPVQDLSFGIDGIDLHKQAEFLCLCHYSDTIAFLIYGRYVPTALMGA